MKKKVPLFKVYNPSNLPTIFKKVLKTGYIAEGEYVKKFSKKISNLIKNKNVVLFNSCTSALTAAYQIAGIKENSEVISTPLTCVAANMPLYHLGAKIVWCDVDLSTGMMSLDHLKKIITQKTKAIVLLHKDGDPYDVNELKKIIKKKKSKAKIIEDAAHAFGAKYYGDYIGNHGDLVAFSFQAIKQIHTIDGGALICKKKSDYMLAKKLKWLGIDRDQKLKKKNIWNNDIVVPGYKANMTDIPAAIGIQQLKNLSNILKIHNQNGRYLDLQLKNIPFIKTLNRNSKNYCTYWVYSFLSKKKKAIEKNLNREGFVSLQVHPRNDKYSIFKKFKTKLPNLDYFQKYEINIPCGWWVKKRDLNKMIKIIKKSA